MTVSQLCDEYRKYGMYHKKPSTISTDIGRINGHIRPLLGHMFVSDVEKSDVEKFLQNVAIGNFPVGSGKFFGTRSNVRGGKGTATRTVRLLGGIFSYAVERGYIKINPKTGVKLFRDNQNERYLNADELLRLGKALERAETIGLPWQLKRGAREKHRPRKQNQTQTISIYVTNAIRLLLLTGCRLREILNLKWEEVDLKNGFLHIPDSKTGKKKIYLSKGAIEILSSMHPIGRYVVLGQNLDNPRADLKRPWLRITNYAELDRVRIHDLRHTFASQGASNGMSLPMIGKLLGHKSPSTTQRYAHLADDPVRRALNEIDSSLSVSILHPLPKSK